MRKQYRGLVFAEAKIYRKAGQAWALISCPLLQGMRKLFGTEQLWSCLAFKVSIEKSHRRCLRGHKTQGKLLKNHSDVHFVVYVPCGSGDHYTGVICKISNTSSTQELN